MDAKKNKLSFEDYLSVELASNTKHEFHDGTIYAMAGGTVDHGLISGNLLVELAVSLKKKKSNCRPINSDVKLHIETSNKYLYPDAMVICGDLEQFKNASNSISNPTVIIEVLSKSTEGYDRGDKFFYYKQIPSLQSYILVDQYQALIDLYTRKSNLWKINRVEGINQKIEIPSLGIELELKDIYQDVF
jgi:Uma2 family endonuclease